MISDPQERAIPWARVVIVAYRSQQVLRLCIDALQAQTVGDFEVVIVDNDCPEKCTEGLILDDARFRVLHSPTNLGFAGGSNLGAKGARTEWLITLNPDAIPTANWLECLIKATQYYPAVNVLSSTLMQANAAEMVDGFGDVLSIYGIAWRGGHGHPLSVLPETDRYVFGPCAAAAAYRRTVFERMEGFDDDFFCYLEDVDLAFRLQMAGEDCVQVCRAVVSHHGGGSSKGDEEFPIYQSFRNNLRVILRNAPLIILPTMMLGFFAAQSYLLLRNADKPETATKLRGLRHAIRSIPAALKSRPQARHTARSGSLRLLRKLSMSPLSLRNQNIVTFGVPRRDAESS